MPLLATRTLTLAIVAACLAALVGCQEKKAEKDPEWIVTGDPENAIALVFIHGIFGDVKATWTNNDGHTFFDFLSSNPALRARIGIYAFGYPSFELAKGSFTTQEAANRLHLRLMSDHVFDYKRIVFVTHSMGGLVALRELLTHREVMKRVASLVFFGVPQEGSEVARLAQHVSRNDALRELIPSDINSVLQQLNDEWRSIPPSDRPQIACAVEKLDIGGTAIVTETSGSRFCDGPAVTIAADHIGIVKPPTSNSDAVVFVLNVLAPLLQISSSKATAGIATPDFMPEGDHASLTIDAPTGVRSVRVANLGDSPLTYLISQFPERGLYVSKDALGPKELQGRQTATLDIVAMVDAQSEYKFVFSTVGVRETLVFVHIRNLQAIRSARRESARSAAFDVVSNAVTLGALQAAGHNNKRASTLFVAEIHDAITKEYAGLDPAAQWMLTADTMNAMNWPSLSGYALANAASLDKDIVGMSVFRTQAAKTAYLSGTTWKYGDATFSAKSAASWIGTVDVLDVIEASSGTLPQSRQYYQLADKMRNVPGLKQFAFSLSGDAQAWAGNRAMAAADYHAAAQINENPSVLLRLGTSLLKTGNVSEALKALEKNSKTYPSALSKDTQAELINAFEDCKTGFTEKCR